MRVPLLSVVIVFLAFLPGCQNDDETITVPNYLIAKPNSVNLSIDANDTVAISGGKPPYSIHTQPKSNVARANIFATRLIITGVGEGSSSVKVKDSTDQIATVYIVVAASGVPIHLTARPNIANVPIAESDTISLSGGTPPYEIRTQPQASVAHATIIENKLIVTGVGSGTTNVEVKDSGDQTALVDIVVFPRF